MVLKKKEHIDDVQPKTIDNHFELIMSNTDIIDDNPADLTPEDLPEWYDERLFKIGQEHYKKNMFAFTTASLAGLVAVLSVSDILKILIFTKRSGTPCNAFKRYTETIFHTTAWYKSDATDITSRWWKSLNTVRWKHSSSSKRAEAAGYGAIKQKDMVLTQFGFFGFAFVLPHKLGLTSNAEEREGFNHFWRVFGHMMGISDRLNLCRKTEAETTELCRRIQYEVYGKYFRNVTTEFETMTKALLQGLWIADLSLDYDAFMCFTYSLMDIPYHKPLGLYSRLNYKFRAIVLYLCAVPIIGYLTRTYLNYQITLSHWFLENCPILPIIRFGRKESRINLYPKYHS